MSSIPQRKKTPEELAALRAQEFANRPTPPPAAVSQAPATLQTNVASRPPLPETPVDFLPAVATEEPVQRLRKSAPRKNGQLQVFDGLRPAAANEIFPAAQGTNAQLPRRKHDDLELQELRHRGLMQTRPPVQRIVAMQLHPFFTGLLYLIAIAVVIFTVRNWSHEGQQRFYSPGAGCSLLLLTSLFLYFKKPRARHHAAILSGISLVVLGFVILLTLKNPYAP